MGRKKRHDRPGRAGKPPESLPQEPRPEAEVFDELRKLTQSAGFIHALASLTFQSTVVTAAEEFTKDDFLKIYQPDRLIRTESNLLMGLMLSSPVDVSVPAPHTTQEYIDRTIALLEELHQAVLAPGHEVFMSAMQALAAGDPETSNPLGAGSMLREAIFYGGESAFPFQYEALARERYASDREWLETHKGFNIVEAADVMSAIRKIVQDNFPKHRETLRGQAPHEWGWLPIFSFTFEEVVERTSIDRAKVEKIVGAFSVNECDEELSVKNLGAYNKSATHPIVRLRDGSLFSFLDYGAFQALYDNPFYWIATDKKYLGKHSQTRGSFVEQFTEATLRKVFPDCFVHRNVVFKSKSGEVVGEADTILLYGYRAFVVQEKSKRLTLASWSGDDISIAKDFSAAVQQAYDQALECIAHIKNGVDAFVDDEPIDLSRFGKIREFYPICITSEHYPALAHQSSVFLKPVEEADVLPPIVTDVFTLDVIAEMLPTPLYFTDYLVKRARAAGRLNISHELVGLSWYLKKNVHIEEDEFFIVTDDIMVELDLAMAVRRLGIEGKATPSGQLTRFAGTPAGKILDHVNKSDRPDVHRLGELILGMGSDAADTLNDGIKRVLTASKRDGQKHDVTMGLQGGGGITVHCNPEGAREATRLLTSHATMRKYVQKADRWYGVLIDSEGEPVFLTGLEFPWAFDAELEAEARPYRIRSVTHSFVGKRKIGRNEPCLCGSGKKYKKCCLQ